MQVGLAVRGYLVEILWLLIKKYTEMTPKKTKPPKQFYHYFDVAIYNPLLFAWVIQKEKWTFAF